MRGALPGRKPETLASADQFAELLAEAAVDVLAIDGDLDVLLARADVLDLDGLVELDGLLALLGDGRGAFRRGGLGGLGRVACFIRPRFVGHDRPAFQP